MEYVISMILCFAWGAACGHFIPNPAVSLAVAIPGGFAIGYFLPPLLGA